MIASSNDEFDDLVIGTGMAGLTTGALLAAEGRRVLMLEAHDKPGGNAHTFEMGAYRFCAQVHYIYHCGEGEPVYELLRRLGLEDVVRFNRLDPEGYEHIVVAGDRYRVPNGLEKYRNRLLHRFPEHERPIRGYFQTIMALGRELDALPKSVGWREILSAPLRFPLLLRCGKWTLQRLYDHLDMPPRLQAILAGQSGDYLLPPSEVSLLLHLSLVRLYDRGAYYPRKHFRHMVDSIAGFIAAKPGCRLLLNTEVDRIVVDKDRVLGVHTTKGETFAAQRYVSNVDPRRTASLVGDDTLPQSYLRTLSYEYSTSGIILYLGVRGLDLREHGFGSFNVWHYPSNDLNELYRRQKEDQDFTDPWLFMSTPTLHTDEPGLCPPGHQILEIATNASYAPFKQLRDTDRRLYNREKKKIRDRILAIVEERYVPNLTKHLAMRITGTPTTEQRYCWAPEGNAYGAVLTPKNVGLHRVSHETPLKNLWLANATAGYPSVGGTVEAGLALVDLLGKSGT